MLPRILGALAILIGLALAGFAVLGLSNAHDMSVLIGMASSSEDFAAEASLWLRHWHLSTGIILASGLGLAVAGLGLYLRRRWSVLLLASVAVLLVVQDLIMWAGGWVRYEFEVPEPAEIAFLLLVATASAIAFRRWRPDKQS